MYSPAYYSAESSSKILLCPEKVNISNVFSRESLTVDHFATVFHTQSATLYLLQNHQTGSASRTRVRGGCWERGQGRGKHMTGVVIFVNTWFYYGFISLSLFKCTVTHGLIVDVRWFYLYRFGFTPSTHLILVWFYFNTYGFIWGKAGFQVIYSGFYCAEIRLIISGSDRLKHMKPDAKFFLERKYITNKSEVNIFIYSRFEAELGRLSARDQRGFNILDK